MACAPTKTTRTSSHSKASCLPNLSRSLVRPRNGQGGEYASARRESEKVDAQTRHPRHPPQGPHCPNEHQVAASSHDDCIRIVGQKWVELELAAGAQVERWMLIDEDDDELIKQHSREQTARIRATGRPTTPVVYSKDGDRWHVKLRLRRRQDVRRKIRRPPVLLRRRVHRRGRTLPVSRGGVKGVQ